MIRCFSAIFIVLLLVSGCNKGKNVTDPAVHYADSLLSIMTLEEKIGQMTAFTSGWDVTGPTLRDSYRDDIISGKCGVIFNAHTVKYNRALQEIAVNQTRLGIPLLFGYDVIHGHKTIFPIPIGEACTWDSVLIEKSARLSAIEAASSGLNWSFNPMVDICRDPRWGRMAEGSGEDVLIGCINARAKVRGFQGEDLSDPLTMAACVKHFAAYGAPVAGRDYNTVDMSERVFIEDYLPPYKAAVEAGVASAMTAFNELFGVPASGSEYLLRGVLRKSLGFDGVIVTDYTSINEMVPHGYATDVKNAAELAIKAGVDIDLQGAAYYNYLKTLVDEKKVDPELIDDAARRVLVMKYKLGLFDDPFMYLDESREKENILSETMFEHAQYAAERSIVLLKNSEFGERKLLPLSKDKLTVAVIGPLAENKVDLLGSWHASGSIKEMKTLTEAIRDEFPSFNVRSAKGAGFEGDDRSGFGQAIKLADASDLVILAVGENYQQSGEAASRTNIDLPGVQPELVDAILSTGKPVVALIFAGRPLTINAMVENVPAIIYAWQPGTMAGPALANVLSGDYNPSAKITVSFPRSVGQIPIYYDAKNTGRPAISEIKYQTKYIDSPNSPLFPFGFGLSYTEFGYGDIVMSDTLLHPGGKINASITIHNTGQVAGEEIIQMYIRDMVGSVTRPVLELKGYSKISLQPGESKIVNFEIETGDLKFLDNKLQWLCEPGEFRLLIGPNSSELKQKGFWLVGS